MNVRVKETSILHFLHLFLSHIFSISLFISLEIFWSVIWA